MIYNKQKNPLIFFNILKIVDKNDYVIFAIK